MARGEEQIFPTISAREIIRYQPVECQSTESAAACGGRDAASANDAVVDEKTSGRWSTDSTHWHWIEIAIEEVVTVSVVDAANYRTRAARVWQCGGKSIAKEGFQARIGNGDKATIGEFGFVAQVERAVARIDVIDHNTVEHGDKTNSTRSHEQWRSTKVGAKHGQGRRHNEPQEQTKSFHTTKSVEVAWKRGGSNTKAIVQW